MADNARGVHVSPGVYSREIDLTYAVKSLGITTLGVAGETMRGPAFQPMHIENWRQFTEVFGGTSTEKFKGSQYPKYELPYIAKSYLTESKQLEVVRVLGLSGYKAGPAWVVTANRPNANGETVKKDMVVAVLRSRGHYEKYHKFDVNKDSCECPSSAYDKLIYEVGEIKRESGTCNVYGYNDIVKLKAYKPLYAAGNECTGYEIDGMASDFKVSSTNYGRFTIYGLKGFQSTGTTEISSGNSDYFEYSVSLNPHDKDFILKVLGTDPQDGDAPLYVESLYDVALAHGIMDGITEPTYIDGINQKLTFYNVYDPSDYCGLEPINGLLRLQESSLQRKNVGQRFVADCSTVSNEDYKGDVYIYAHPYDYETGLPFTFDNLFKTTATATENKDSSGSITSYTVTVNGNLDTEFVSKNFGDASGSVCCIYDDEIKKIDEINFTGTGTCATAEESGTTVEAIIADHFTPEGLILSIINKDLIGQVFTVARYVDNQGKVHYFYKYYPEANVKKWGEDHKNVDLVPIVDKLQSGSESITNKDYNDKGESTRLVIVKNLADNLYYKLVEDENIEKSDCGGKDVRFVNCDLNNYASPYRYASTPWIVSNLKGDYNHIELNKLFRFHTISDGTNSNYEIKISIENIRPDEGVFDVVVRDINDSDEFIMPLEKFSKCTLTPGDRNYIGYKIGTFDGIYETKSKFITVEIAEGTAVEHSAPAGFLGYPMAHYDGLEIVSPSEENEKKVDGPTIKYNLYYDNDVKNRKQYFGLSTRVGVDVDTFTYKGKAAYIDLPEMLTQGFHLDSRLDKSNYKGGHLPYITVDGESGYTFDAVSVNNRTSVLTDIPAIGTEELMNGSIYEYVNLRKFTVYFYGGFDGWDIYRNQRSNTDDFKMSKYLGVYDNNSGEGYSFNRIDDPDGLGLNQNGITSDWYAYLAAYRQFANPEAVDINVFASPGIDYVNNKTLVNEVIDMLEEERADSIYVVTTPDKPSGAADFVDEMYTPDDAVYNLEDTEIDSNYTCTYYPWVKYLDQDNNQYIYLPATKDVVRNFAQTDNQTFPWFAPAGLERGDVNCVRAHFITKLADEDVLYEGRINPIKTFATDGVKVWGQKNLQVRESQLNRIAVRRLLLRMRKLIAIACRSLIFEPNDPVTKNMFLSAVSPIMDNIRANRGISDYKIEVNDTPESRDRRELPAKIYFKPYNALEYVVLDFILTPEGVSFDNI